MQVTAAAGHVPNLHLVLRVLAARAFLGLRILLLALGLMRNQPLFDRLLATEVVRNSGFIDCSACKSRDRKLVLVVVSHRPPPPGSSSEASSSTQPPPTAAVADV